MKDRHEQSWIQIYSRGYFCNYYSLSEFAIDPWFWLIIAILFEVAGTVSLKISDGLTKTIPSILTVLFYVLSFYVLAYTLKKMDVGLAYAIWAGLGTAIIAFVGVIYFGEPVSITKVISIILIVTGVIGLNLAGGIH